MNRESYLIRAMRSADIDRVLEIAAGLENTPHWPRAAYLTALDHHAEPRRLALVAVEVANDFPVGFAIASLVHPGAELESMAVVQDRQRLGLGRGLLLRLFDVLKREGIQEVWL
jgi:ribosomal protein S18 acetylase RimI-like enzyme